MIEIEKTYQNQYRTQGALIGQQFYAERNALLAQLKPLLNKLTKKQLKFRDYADLKRALGLSTKSIVMNGVRLVLVRFQGTQRISTGRQKLRFI